MMPEEFVTIQKLYGVKSSTSTYEVIPMWKQLGVSN